MRDEGGNRESELQVVEEGLDDRVLGVRERKWREDVVEADMVTADEKKGVVG